MVYVFDDFALDTSRGELRRNSELIKLERQVFQVLAYLVQHHGQIIAKQELIEHLWPQSFISDWALARCIKVARKVIGDSGRRQRIIHGARYGYRALRHHAAVLGGGDAHHRGRDDHRDGDLIHSTIGKSVVDRESSRIDAGLIGDEVRIDRGRIGQFGGAACGHGPQRPRISQRIAIWIA